MQCVHTIHIHVETTIIDPSDLLGTRKVHFVGFATSLTLSFGVYGTSQLVLPPNYSHLIEASPIFVKDI